MSDFPVHYDLGIIFPFQLIQASRLACPLPVMKIKLL